VTTEVLDRWTALGWLRPLDRAFAAFCARQRPDAAPAALLGAALVSHQVGRGHVCLDLASALQAPRSVLGLPPEDALPGDGPAPEAVLQDLTVEGWLAALAPLLQAPEGDCAPLAALAHRLYPTRFHRAEARLAQALRARAETAPGPDADTGGDDDLPADLAPAQRAALACGLERSLALISGGPGTGKTHTIAALVRRLGARRAPDGGRLRIALAAPTGKAAARLQAGLEGAGPEHPVQTLHRLLGARPHTRRLRHDRENPLHVDVLVIDEASMVDLELMTAVVDALPDDARLVLVGDRDQLASVEPGAVFSELCDPAVAALAPCRVTLEQNFRFAADSAIAALARAVNEGEGVAEALAGAGDDLTLTALAGAGDPALVRALHDGYAPYLDLLDAPGVIDPAAALARLGAFRVLCGPRSGPWGVAAVNAILEAHPRFTGAPAGADGWYHGRPVLVTRNDRDLGLYNGDVGVTLRDERGALRVWFETEGRLRPLAPGRLGSAETVWGMTVHKAQGSEFDHVALLLPDRPTPLYTRELLYTGITRARRRLTLLSGDPALLPTLARTRTHRASGLAARLGAGSA
jgi:exodeoxyribonuclease V alpha subunit